MIRKAIQIKLFIGYQFDSKLHTSEDFQKMGNELKKRLYKHNLPIDLIIQLCEFAPGTRLWDEILEQITNSDVTIFDISENNPNVLLEAGISYGSNKQVILLKNETYRKDFPIPTNLTSSFVYVPYKSSDELYKDLVLKYILKSIYYFLEKNHDPCFYYRSLWGLSQNSKTIIIPSRPPTASNGIEFEDYIYIRKYGDLDALFLINQTLLRLYPKMEIEISNAENLSSLPDGWNECNLILIGGPDFNPIVKNFDDLCPFEYKYGDENEVWLLHRNTKKELITEISNKKSTVEDFGFFHKQNLNKNGVNKLIIIGGAHTLGVYGGAKLFNYINKKSSYQSYKNSMNMINKYGSDPLFSVYFKVKGNRDSIHQPTLDFEKVEIIPN